MSQQRVLLALREHIAVGKVGDRLPTVRALMRDLQVSQPAVQGAIKNLTDLGLVASHVGRGTFIAQARPSSGRRHPTVLVLSARSQSDRNHRVGALLLRELSERGARPLQVVYDRLDHAIEALESGLTFDLTVVQSQLETVPVRLLDFLQRGSRPVIIDGSRLSGIDVDIVSSNWPAALDLALGVLRDAGHRRIGFVTSPSPARSMESLRQHFESLRQWMKWESEEWPLILLDRSPAIGEPSTGLIQGALSQLKDRQGRLPVSALVVWGGNDGVSLAEALEREGIKVPADLSLAMIGHSDLDSMHLGRFTIAGPTVEETARLLTQAVFDRSENPLGAVKTTYVKSTLLLNDSIVPASDL